MTDHEEEFEQLIIPEAGADIDEEIGYDIPQELSELGIDINEFFQKVREIGHRDALAWLEHLQREQENEETITEEEQEQTQGREEQDEDEDKINLSTDKFISPLTGEEIKLTSINIYDRISEIYYHTGVSITHDDPLLVQGRNKGYSSFSRIMAGFDEKLQKELKKQLGSNWDQILLNSYVESWNNIMDKKIEEQKDKAFARLREDYINERERNNQTENSQELVEEQTPEVQEITSDEVEEDLVEEASPIEYDGAEISSMSLEDIETALNSYNGEPITINGVIVHPFNEPLAAAYLNAEYKKLTGKDHSVFMEQVPKVIERLLDDKESLIESGAYPESYFTQLESIMDNIDQQKKQSENREERVEITPEEDIEFTLPTPTNYREEVEESTMKSEQQAQQAFTQARENQRRYDWDVRIEQFKIRDESIYRESAQTYVPGEQPLPIEETERSKGGK